MPAKGKKSLPIDGETHRVMKTYGAQRGIKLQDVVRLAWMALKDANVGNDNTHNSGIEKLRVMEPQLTPEVRYWSEVGEWEQGVTDERTALHIQAIKDQIDVLRHGESRGGPLVSGQAERTHGVGKTRINPSGTIDKRGNKAG